jgi:hypothetical protein
MVEHHRIPWHLSRIGRLLIVEGVGFLAILSASRGLHMLHALGYHAEHFATRRVRGYASSTTIDHCHVGHYHPSHQCRLWRIPQ